MANPEHLEIIKQGVEVWNDWADLHRAVPDLSFADLSNAQLRRANLTYANLSGANLSHADLTVANLVGTNLVGAHLSNASLIHARLGSASLTNADLSNADLSAAIINDTKLSGAKLNSARLGYTIFSDTDLSEAIGLDTIRHTAPSEVGISTLYRSRGRIPAIFLRGCGVTESFIVQIKALIASTEPIQFYSCFISYSSKDKDFADRLYADLQNKGVRCWFAPDDMKIGDKFRTRIDESIRIYDKLLLVLSENSVSSQWVEKEVETAIEREGEQHKTMLFPVRLDDAVTEMKVGWPADVRRTRHIGDFTRWKNHDSYQKAFDRLLRDLKAEDKKH
jgi:uncharacterized protein YjbI with pentapeptide repeats